MSKDVSEKMSLELALLAALDRVDADVNTSEIAEIQDWSRAVRGNFYGASVEKPSRLSKLKAGLLSVSRWPRVANAPGPSAGHVSGTIPAASSNVASHGSVQYSQMTIPQLIAVCCTSESSETAWHEFIRRVRPIILMTIVKVVGRHGNASYGLVDDLSQEVYLKLCQNNFRALRAVETGEAFVGLVKAIAPMVAQDYFRSAASSKRGAREALEADCVFPQDVFRPGASSGSERNVLLQEIDAILKTHSHEPNFERDYAIFWLYYRHGLTAKEIAASPGVELSVRGVESTLSRLARHTRSALMQGTKKSNPK